MKNKENKLLVALSSIVLAIGMIACEKSVMEMPPQDIGVSPNSNQIQFFEVTDEDHNTIDPKYSIAEFTQRFSKAEIIEAIDYLTKRDVLLIPKGMDYTFTVDENGVGKIQIPQEYTLMTANAEGMVAQQNDDKSPIRVQCLCSDPTQDDVCGTIRVGGSYHFIIPDVTDLNEIIRFLAGIYNFLWIDCVKDIVGADDCPPGQQCAVTDLRNIIGSGQKAKINKLIVVQK